MDRQDVYLVDIGVLLKEGDKNYENYSTVYDKKYGYDDEGQYYVRTLEEAMKDAFEYMDGAIDGSYIVISNTWIPTDCDPSNTPVEDENYDPEAIVYSARVENGELVENFVEGQLMSLAVTASQFDKEQER